MKNVVRTIKKVIQSSALADYLCCIPTFGATNEEIQALEDQLGHVFSEEHKKFLKFWNGINLEIIRLFGCGKTERFIPNFLENQLDDVGKDLVTIASDPAGFLYAENKSGEIFSIDTDGGAIEKISNSFEDFICNLVFGEKAREFAGEEWEKELIEAGLFGKLE